jgi:hypothetical protein
MENHQETLLEIILRNKYHFFFYEDAPADFFTLNKTGGLQNQQPPVY